MYYSDANCSGVCVCVWHAVLHINVKKSFKLRGLSHTCRLQLHDDCKNVNSVYCV